MNPQHIPVSLDHTQILDSLNQWGIRDYKIEAICGFTIGYVAQLRCGAIKQMTYQRAARLYNFYVAEWHLNASRGTLSSQCATETTT